MTLNEVMKDTADAIREKTGKSEKIAPVNFAEEIKSISAGGGESGGSNWRYFDVSEMDDATKEGLWALSQICRCFVMNSDAVQPPLLASKYGVSLANIYCIGFDFSLMVKDAQGTSSVEQMLSKYGMLDTLLAKEITEDEFLNKTFE